MAAVETGRVATEGELQQQQHRRLFVGEAQERLHIMVSGFNHLL
jgi:hypothetical protein